MRRLLLVMALLVSANATANSKSLTGEASNTKAAGSEPAKSLIDCGPLLGQTLSYVCNRIADPNTRLQCFTAGHGAYLDQCALGACDRYVDANATVSCVYAIADRAYTLDEVLNCDRIPDANQTTQCFANSGRYVGDGGGDGSNGSVDIREVRYRVSVALSLIRSGNTPRAEYELQRLIDYIDSNQW